MGLVGIPLQLLPVNRAVSRVQSGNSVPLLRQQGFRGPYGDSKVQQGIQALHGVEAWNSAFLSSCQRAVRPPVEFRWGIWAFSRTYEMEKISLSRFFWGVGGGAGGQAGFGKELLVWNCI